MMSFSALGAAHGAAAIAALGFGLFVLADRKGTSAHRALGAAYVAAMVATNGTALGIYRLTGQIGPFHLLALISLATVARGVAAVLRRRPGWLARHYACMAWSYLGLLSAAAAEAISRAPLAARWVHNGVDGMRLGLVCVAAILLVGFFLVPRLQARALAGAAER
ncbi:MAG TPA: DUF2306 domain-containing protein [Xanthobacteraceae bacterium]|nr:DUF2306 domain-containing protein [Xanthobacteraceae bacterium]